MIIIKTIAFLVYLCHSLISVIIVIISAWNMALMRQSAPDEMLELFLLCNKVSNCLPLSPHL